MKVENLKEKSQKKRQLEFQIYKAFNGSQEIPHYFAFTQESSYNVLAIELMGSSLEDLIQKHQLKKKRF